MQAGHPSYSSINRYVTGNDKAFLYRLPTLVLFTKRLSFIIHTSVTVAEC